MCNIRLTEHCVNRKVQLTEYFFRSILPAMKTDVISTNEAAEILGVTPRRVLALIESGKLPALKLGRFYALRREDLGRVTTYGKAGRPPAKKSKKAAK